MKDPNKDCRCTVDIFLSAFKAFSEQFLQGISWYQSEYYTPVFPDLTAEQLQTLQRQMDAIKAAVDAFYEQLKGMSSK